jgi:protein pelota
MKIIYKNLKQGIIKIRPENLDDLWCLSSVISKGDYVSGKTYRKIVIGDKEKDRAKSVKKPMFLCIEVEKVSFSDNLTILGRIKQGPDDIPINSHHSFNIQENDEIEIKKEWLSYQLKKIEDSTKRENDIIIACIFNREEAIFGKLQNNKFNLISSVKGDVEKKVDGSNKGSNFFKEINRLLEELNGRINPKFILLGCSHMWKSNIEKEIVNLRQKIVFAPVNDVSEHGFSELLLRNEVSLAMTNQQASKDAKLIEEMFSEISKDNKIVYGLKDCIYAASLASIENLVCSENLIKEKRENDNFEELEELLKNVDQNKGKVHLVSGKGDHVKRLDGLGGIIAKLRFDLGNN